MFDFSLFSESVSKQMGDVGLALEADALVVGLLLEERLQFLQRQKQQKTETNGQTKSEDSETMDGQIMAV